MIWATTPSPERVNDAINKMIDSKHIDADGTKTNSSFKIS